MTRYSILLGGPVVATDRLIAQLAGRQVIAADSGIAHAVPLGLAVDLWVGDFDSADAASLAAFADVPRAVHPVDKAKTDGELAVDEAVRRGARDLLLVGGFGGQSDHVLGHFMLALRLARAGLTALLTSGQEEAHALLPGRTHVALPPGSRLSLIALSDLTGLHLSGTRWPLADARVEIGSTLTLSNVAEGPVEIDLASGHGLIVAYPAG